MAVRNVDKAAAWVKSLDVNDPDLAKTVESGKKKFAGMELAGKTLGVIGLGKIGVLVANYARWKNMRVLAYEPYPNAANITNFRIRLKRLRSKKSSPSPTSSPFTFRSSRA